MQPPGTSPGHRDGPSAGRSCRPTRARPSREGNQRPDQAHRMPASRGQRAPGEELPSSRSPRGDPPPRPAWSGLPRHRGETEVGRGTKALRGPSEGTARTPTSSPTGKAWAPGTHLPRVQAQACQGDRPRPAHRTGRPRGTRLSAPPALTRCPQGTPGHATGRSRPPSADAPGALASQHSRHEASALLCPDPRGQSSPAPPPGPRLTKPGPHTRRGAPTPLGAPACLRSPGHGQPPCFPGLRGCHPSHRPSWSLLQESPPPGA